MIRVVAEMPDGSVEVITPQLWALLRLCRGHPDFDAAAAVRELCKGGLTEDEIAAAGSRQIDLDREERKLRANPDNSEEHISAYLGYHAAGNEGGRSLEEAVSLIMAKGWRHAARWKIVDADQVPNCSENERAYRNGLKYDLTHDMGKCREIARDRARRLREPKLAALDIEYYRADEAKDEKAKEGIAARKQVLRDLTTHPRLDAATTIDELAAAVADITK
jgi:hypothetical protein